MFVLLLAGCLWASEPPSPEGALLRSAILPGWGQWANGHPVKGLMLEVAEVVLAGMAWREWKAGHPRRRNTFILWWLGARLYGMADAYVDAHLRGFDEGEDLKVPEGNSRMRSARSRKGGPPRNALGNLSGR
ncbi:MAG: hypothetical protein DRP94_02640 [Candidatus Latescibacterota bacterium]|nr:MAG: hypothetical protein DRP94_02640 [Candidatus Latescibacterota bacterium]RKY74049.1 MAG: hypothetical protein DRQ14_03030 [Candidatus Latescibacterota bacterium]